MIYAANAFALTGAYLDGGRAHPMIRPEVVIMGELMSQQKQTAARRGWLAVAGWLGSGWALVGGHIFLTVVGVGVAVYLTRNWFQYRAKWGMRF